MSLKKDMKSKEKRKQCEACTVLFTAAASIPHPCLYDQRALTLLGLTGFDMSSGGRACDPICSESLNGAKTELPTSSSLLPPDTQVVKRHRDQKWRTGPIHRSPATEAGDDS